MFSLKSLIHFSLFFAKKDIKSRFAGSLLGVFWLFVQPMCFIVIYFFVFSTVLKIRLSSGTGTQSFLVFLLTGLFPWMGFQEGCMRAATSIIDNGEAVKKIPFPLESLPLGVIISAACMHLTALVIFVIGYGVYLWIKSHTFLPLTVLFLPVLMFLQILATLGIGLFLAGICTYLRDLIQVFNLLFQVWFYATPIVYPIYMIPKKLQPFVKMNPLTGLTELYRDVILKGKLSFEVYKGWSIVFVLLALWLGIKVFKRLKLGFADVL
jgi:ABC-type polysaccharide/polyol phosphate export permease